jgi:hypothetical protein
MLWLYKLLKRANCNYKLNPEAAVQVRFADQLRLLSLENKLRCVWFAVCNEIGSANPNPRYGVYLQALGKIAGTPDMVFLWDGGCGVIEFKSAKGRQSEEQQLFQKWCDATHVKYEIARSLEEANAILCSWGLL